MRCKEISKPFGLSENGFTLIEISLVVLLMALMAGMVAVMFVNALPQARMKAAARDLTATIKYARNLAYATQETQNIHIDLNAGSYSLNGRRPKSLSGDTTIAVYETNDQSVPTSDGKYTIAYDATFGSNWSSIILTRRGKILTIKADPVVTAFTVLGNRHENTVR